MGYNHPLQLLPLAHWDCPRRTARHLAFLQHCLGWAPGLLLQLRCPQWSGFQGAACTERDSLRHHSYLQTVPHLFWGLLQRAPQVGSVIMTIRAAKQRFALQAGHEYTSMHSCCTQPFRLNQKI